MPEEQQSSEEDDDLIPLNEEENIHVASRSLGTSYRSAFTGRDVPGDSPSLHIHGPEGAGNENEDRGFVIVRIADVDEATSLLYKAADNPAEARQIPDLSVATPNTDYARCAGCHDRVEETAFCFVRTAQTGSTHRADAVLRALSGNDFETPREVWCHQRCVPKVVEAMESVWEHSDELIPDAL